MSVGGSDRPARTSCARWIRHTPLPFGPYAPARRQLVHGLLARSNLAHLVVEGHFRATARRTSIGGPSRGTEMTVHFKMLETMRQAIIRDLRRPHAHAAERV